VDLKRDLVGQLLQEGARPAPTSRWALEPLNVLDAQAFQRLADWGSGPLCVLNEGLLVYLNDAEKLQLCDHVRALLVRRGGCWVTGDIYVRLANPEDSLVIQDEASARFHAEHHTEENKFLDFPSAEAFFSQAGLKVTARTVRDSRRTVTRQTWRLEAV